MAEVPPIQVDIKPPVQTTAAALTQTTAVSGGGAAGVITLKWVFMGCPLPPPDTVLTVMAAALSEPDLMPELPVSSTFMMSVPEPVTVSAPWMLSTMPGVAGIPRCAGLPPHSSRNS